MCWTDSSGSQSLKVLFKNRKKAKKFFLTLLESEREREPEGDEPKLESWVFLLSDIGWWTSERESYGYGQREREEKRS